MSKSLKEKIAILLTDCERLQRFEQVRRIENLVNEEIEFHKAEHIIDSHVLTVVRSRAISKMTNNRTDQDALGRIHSDPDLIRTLYYFESVIEFLRSEGLINFTTPYNKK